MFRLLVNGLPLWLLVTLSSLWGITGVAGAVVGFNYGTQLSTPPTAAQLINLLKVQHIPSIRLYDTTNSTLLVALGGTGVQVALSIPNTQLLSIGGSNATAVNWVKANILPYYPKTNITSIVVGNEVFTSLPNAAPLLLPAMNNLYSALVSSKLDKQIKVSTPFSPSLILDSFPPSQAFFNKTWNGIMQPVLSFLSQTGSFLMLNIYPYDIYKASNGVVSLDYALMNPLSQAEVVVDSNTLLQYTNVLDAVIDAAVFALGKLNFTTLPIVLGETGWPSQGDADDKEATVDNAATYNSNLIRHIVNNTGTPKRPRAAINTFIMELFNEDLKIGPTTSKHYGLFNSSTTFPLYLLHLSGSGPLLANDTTSQLYCVAKPGIDEDTLQIALDWACGIGHANCSAIQPGMLCYVPDTVPNHASYAFNAYYQMNNRSDDSCTFNGASIVTTTNPSYGACVYPGSPGAAGNSTVPSVSSGGNSTSNATGSSNSTSSSSSSIAMHASFPFFSLAALLATGLIITS